MKLNEIKTGKSVADLKIEYTGGDFYCYYNELTSLQGGPKEVGGDFYCSDNKLTSLQGAPTKVGSHFYCSNNKLTSFKDLPLKKMNGIFNFRNNPIKSHVLKLLLIEGVRAFICLDKLLQDILNDALEQFPNEPKKRVLYAQKRLLDEHENGQELAKL